MTTRSHLHGSLALGLALAALLPAATADAARVELDVALAQPLLEAGDRRTTYLKVGLTGFGIGERERIPVNVALVIDRSGSMQGEKLLRAKEAALEALDRLGPQDIVSVVAYDHTIRVLVPATKVSDRDVVRRAIQRLEAGGNTALFAGVSKGAAEVRKFFDRHRVNRIILLSDGLANVGPSSPSELGALGASLKEEGIAVSTIGLGLGYNEDLMSRLAARSDGNHAFVEHPRDLVRIFDFEFGDVLSVVAQEIVVRIQCPPGVRPVRVLGREAEVVGQSVITTLNQLYAEQEKYLLVELEVPAGRSGDSRRLASVDVSYANMATHSADHLSDQVEARFTHTADLARASENRDVMVAVLEQITTERSERAVILRDQGRVQEAEQLLLGNVYQLEAGAQQYGSEQLQELAESNQADAEGLSEEEWARRRKAMREQQEKTKLQRVW